MYRYPLIFGIVVLLLIIGVFELFSGHGSKPTPVTQSQVKPLPSYADTTAQVSMTIDGHINGDDEHRQIKVTVSATERDMDVIQGYSGTVINHQQFYNTTAAYDVFLRAINNGAFLLPLKNTKAPISELGQSPLGFRYIFQLSQNGNSLSRLWASSCSTSIGTFGGDPQLMQELFEAQIPKYEDTADTIQL